MTKETKIETYRVHFNDEGELEGDVEKALEIYKETAEKWWEGLNDKERVEVYLRIRMLHQGSHLYW